MELKETIDEVLAILQKNISSEVREKYFVLDDDKQMHAYIEVQVDVSETQRINVSLPIIIPPKKIVI